MRTLVIGGSRFVGLHLVFHLLRLGHEVAVLNRGVTPANELPSNIERIYADRRNFDQMKAALAGRRFDAVFDIVLEQTADGDVLAEALPHMGHYIMCSGTRIYAASDLLPVREESPIAPNPGVDSIGYARLKSADLLTETGKRHGYPVTVLRPHRIYGPHTYNLAWEPSFFARVEGGLPIVIPGNGETLHQWMHVDDFAKAFIACLGNTKSHGQVYIVGGSEYVTLNGYVGLIGETAGRKADVLHLDAAKAKSITPFFPYNWDYSRIFSIEKIERELGWRPAIMLSEGLADSYRWYKSAGLGQSSWDFGYEGRVAAAIRENRWPP